MVQHLAFSVCHHKAVSSSLSRGTNEFLDKSKQNQPECVVIATHCRGGTTNLHFHETVHTQQYRMDSKNMRGCLEYYMPNLT